MFNSYVWHNQRVISCTFDCGPIWRLPKMGVPEKNHPNHWNLWWRLGDPENFWKPKNESIHQEIGDQDPTKTWLIFYFFLNNSPEKWEFWEVTVPFPWICWGDGPRFSCYRGLTAAKLSFLITMPASGCEALKWGLLSKATKNMAAPSRYTSWLIGFPHSYKIRIRSSKSLIMW